MSGALTTLLAGTALLSSMALTFVPAGMFHPAAVAAGPAIAVDATGSGTASSVSSFTASITTVAANTILLAWVGNVTGASPPTVSSVTATGLTFAKRSGVNFTGNVSNGIDFELWWAKVATPGSYTVTANSSSFLNGYLGLVSYKNVNQVAPFDPSGFASGGNSNTVPFGTNTALTSAYAATSNPGCFMVGGAISGLGVSPSVGVNGETQDLKFAAVNIEHIALTGTAGFRQVTWNNTTNYWAAINDALQPAYPASAIFIDATAPGAMSTASSVNATIVTHVANTIILAWVTNIGANATSSVSGGSLTWTKRQGNTDSTSGGTAQNQELWWALAASAGSYTITATWGSSQTNAKINLVAYANVHTVTPFDPNISLPATHNLNNGTAGNMTTSSVSTSVNGSMLVGGFNVAGGNAYYPGTHSEVFDVSDQSNNSPVEHFATTTTFSSKAITFAYSGLAGGTATNWVSIVDALQPLPPQIIFDAAFNSSGTGASASTLSATVTTAGPNELLVAFVFGYATIGGSGDPTDGTFSGGGLTWKEQSARNAQQITQTNFVNCQRAFAAAAPSQLTSQTITLTLTRTLTSSEQAYLVILAFKNANIVAPLGDSNINLPAIGHSSGGALNQTGATSMPFTAALNYIMSDSAASPALKSGWTSAFSNTLINVGYIIEASPQSSISGGTSTSASNSGILDAIVAANGGNDANTQLLVHGDGFTGSQHLEDFSQNFFSPTNNGSTANSSVQKKFGSTSILFNGTSQYISYTTSSLLNPTSGDFTFDCWVYFNSVASNQSLVCKAKTSAAPAFSPYQLFMSASGTLSLYMSSTGTSWDVINAQTVQSGIATGAWHHVAVVRNGSNVYTFWDGTLTSTTNIGSVSLVNNSTIPLTIGANSDGNSYLSAYVDEIRYSSVARWTATFTPPSVTYY